MYMLSPGIWYFSAWEITIYLSIYIVSYHALNKAV